MSGSNGEQSAGLSTAESDTSSAASATANPSKPRVVVAEMPSPSGSHGEGTTTPKPARTSNSRSRSPSRSRLRRMISLSPHRGGRPSSARELKPSYTDVDATFDQSISHSAPTVLIHTQGEPFRRPIRSAMSARTLHESLHRGEAVGDRPAKGMDRCVSWANVNIREYERILGDNPSVTSGPPIAIGWRHAPQPIVASIDDYEVGKGSPRSSREFLVPRQVRESLIREHAGVSRKEIARSIRGISKEKAQRRKTVVNLGMQKSEERVEGVRRKIKKILKPSTTYEAQEAKLWDDAHAAAMEKARRLEESIRRGESVSVRKVYSVGTPYDNILPSRMNSQMVMGMDHEQEKEREDSDLGLSLDPAGEPEAALESMAKQFAPKPTKNQQPPTSGSLAAEELDDQRTSLINRDKPGSPRSSFTSGGQPSSQHSSFINDGQPSSQPSSFTSSFTSGNEKESHLRSSSKIVATESESEEIFAKLVMDDVSHHES